MSDYFRTTDYGFEWGPVEVERVAHFRDRGYFISVGSSYYRVEIYVSERGRTVKVVTKRDKNGGLCEDSFSLPNQGQN